jgi:hypothetical protein
MKMTTADGRDHGWPINLLAELILNSIHSTNYMVRHTVYKQRYGRNVLCKYVRCMFESRITF